MQVSFTNLALADLDNIRTYISKENLTAAIHVATAIVDAADRLSANPRLGRLGAVPGTFELVVRPYVLVYEIQRNDLVVLRIWHGRQLRLGM